MPLPRVAAMRKGGADFGEPGCGLAIDYAVDRCWAKAPLKRGNSGRFGRGAGDAITDAA